MTTALTQGIDIMRRQAGSGAEAEPMIVRDNSPPMAQTLAAPQHNHVQRAAPLNLH